MDLKKLQLHDIYGKHMPTGKKWYSANEEGHEYCLQMCPCGRWYFISSSYPDVVDPLYGDITSISLRDYPELYESLRDYFAHYGKTGVKMGEIMRALKSWDWVVRDAARRLTAKGKPVPEHWVIPVAPEEGS